MPSRRPALPALALGLLGAAFILFWSGLPAGRPARGGGPVEDEREAVRLMNRSLDELRRARTAAGLPIDGRTDLNRTGLIGVETSPTTTSLGHLEAKRTAANPAFAGALVRMLREAGVVRGDAVAIGASGSFPGLVVASLCACQAMGVRALPIVSLGASNWGANDPRWSGLDIVEGLNAAGVLDVPVLAVSLGGEGDAGQDMAPDGRALLRRRAADWGGRFLPAAPLPDAVAARMRLCEEHAAGSPVKAFINVGGSWVDMGRSAEVLRLRPGFNPAAEVILPPVGERGLIQAWAARGVPVIHLLFVKGLCDRYGIAWDPVPFAAPDVVDGDKAGTGRTKTILAAAYIVVTLAGMAWIGIRRRLV